jgi:hypothetical protein
MQDVLAEPSKLNEPVAAPEKLMSRAFFSLVAVEALPFTPFKGEYTTAINICNQIKVIIITIIKIKTPLPKPR